MGWDQDQVEELKSMYGNVQEATEGGVVFFLISNLKLPSGCNPQVINALLCPTARDGYTSRLFFCRKIETDHIPKQPINWNSLDQRILENNWCAYSWKINRTDLRLAQMVVNHLIALQQ